MRSKHPLSIPRHLVYLRESTQQPSDCYNAFGSDRLSAWLTVIYSMLSLFVTPCRQSGGGGIVGERDVPELACVYPVF